MIASGSLKIPAGFTGPIAYTGLPFTPKRITFLTCTKSPTYATNLSHGMWSSDCTPSEGQPEQSCFGLLIAGGVSTSKAEVDSVAYVLVSNPTPEQIRIVLTQAVDNSFSINIPINNMSEITLVHWVATP